MSKRLNFLNKGISTLTGILVISSIAFLAAGFIAYQYWWLSRQEAEMPEVKIPIIEIDKTECQDEWVMCTHFLHFSGNLRAYENYAQFNSRREISLDKTYFRR